MMDASVLNPERLHLEQGLGMSFTSYDLYRTFGLVGLGVAS